MPKRELLEMQEWRNILELNRARVCAGGSADALRAAVRRGADLRIYTEFRHNEHVDPSSDNDEIVREVSDFRVTYLVEDRWVAGIMNLRMPIVPPSGFGPRASMSFFMYNENGLQAIARPYLDGMAGVAAPGPAEPEKRADMPKYRPHDAWDSATNAPSMNFTYDFEVYRFFVRDDWREVLAHAADGRVTAGSFAALTEAFSMGAEIKVAITGLCRDLGSDIDHEVFMHAGPGYHGVGTESFCVGLQPVVRVKPNIPMRYRSRGWDFGWLMARTDGLVKRWLCDPYTLTFRKSQGHYPLRWFVR